MNDELYERGLKIRKAVLGDAYVDKAIASATEFTQPLQRLVTEQAWGGIWGREELPRKTRSMINLAMLTALNRPEELRLHVRGAIHNGLTREEIREVLLQVAIYAGVQGAKLIRSAEDVHSADLFLSTGISRAKLLSRGAISLALLIMLIAAGLALVYPKDLFDYIGLALIVVAVVLQKLRGDAPNAAAGA